MTSSNSRRFRLRRDVDETGVSGTGYVAEGVEFTSGMVAMTWLSPHRCINVYESIHTVEVLHGHGGKTVVEWIDSRESTRAKEDADKILDLVAAGVITLEQAGLPGVPPRFEANFGCAQPVIVYPPVVVHDQRCLSLRGNRADDCSCSDYVVPPFVTETSVCPCWSKEAHAWSCYCSCHLRGSKR